MSKFTEALEPEKPTVRLFVRETPSGTYKLRLMSVDPKPDRGLFRSGSADKDD